MSNRLPIQSFSGKSPATASTSKSSLSSSKPHSRELRANKDSDGDTYLSTGPRRGRKRAKEHHEDEFAGSDCDDIRWIDKTRFKSGTRSKPIDIDDDDDEYGDGNIVWEVDLTPFKNTASSVIDTTTPRSLLSTEMQSSSSVARAANMVTAQKEKPKQLHSEGKSENRNDDPNLPLEESQISIVSNLDSNEGATEEEEVDDEQQFILSLDQLTQEEVDFDAMFESGDAVSDDADDEQDNSRMMDCDNEDPSESRALKQRTLSQFYSKEDQPNRPKPKIANFVVCNGRQFFKGDVWQHKTVLSRNEAYYNCSNMIVKIKSCSTARGRGGKREQVANVENNFYLPLEKVDWLRGDLAQSVIENRRSKGRVGPEFVQYKLRVKPSSVCDTSTSTPLHPISLQRLAKRITTPVSSDLIFGFEDKGSTKGGCFFQFNPSAVSEKKRVAIPKNSNGNFTALELYSGAGGFSLGLKDAGFCVTHHVDNDTAACSTLKANFPDSKVLQCKVKDFLIGCMRNPTSSRYPKVGSITLLHGSSPCQGFSRANRNGGANDAVNNAETYQFMDVVKHFQPPFVTFENVEGMVEQKKNREYAEKMMAEFLKMDYQVRLCLVTASDYGDPQTRKRVFILAAKEGLELPCLPQPTHGKDPSLLRTKTAGDALKFLEDIDPLEYEGEVRATLDGVAIDLQGHIARYSERNKEDIGLTADAPASTVIKRREIRHYANGERPLTRLERSLLQSFPPTYEFYGTDKEIRDQVGNAVPVCLARAIGKSVMDAIRRSGG